MFDPRQQQRLRAAMFATIALVVPLRTAVAHADPVQPATLISPARGAVVAAASRPTFTWSTPGTSDRSELTVKWSGDTADYTEEAGTIGVGASGQPGSHREYGVLWAGAYTWTVTNSGADDAFQPWTAPGEVRHFTVPLVARIPKATYNRKLGLIDTIVVSNAPLTKITYLLKANGRVVYKNKESRDGRTFSRTPTFTNLAGDGHGTVGTFPKGTKVTYTVTLTAGGKTVKKVTNVTA